MDQVTGNPLAGTFVRTMSGPGADSDGATPATVAAPISGLSTSSSSTVKTIGLPNVPSIACVPRLV